MIATERAGHPHEEILRRFGDLALLRVAQQVAVVDSTQAEIFEPSRGERVDGVVELACVEGDEFTQSIVDDAEFGPARHRLRERLNLLTRDFLVDVGRKQPCGQKAVFRFLGGQRGGRADRQLIEFARACAIVDAADRLQCNAHRIDRKQVFGIAADRAHDLAKVNHFAAAIAFGHPHLGWTMRGGQGENIASRGCGNGLTCRRAGEGRVEIHCRFTNRN